MKRLSFLFHRHKPSALSVLSLRELVKMLKEISDECKELTSARLESTSSHRQVSAAFAAEALTMFLRTPCDEEQENGDELIQQCKDLRRTLRKVAKSGEEKTKNKKPREETDGGNSRKPQKPSTEIDYGQYDSDTLNDTFKDHSKAEKFARLMGGQKPHEVTHHTTHVASSTELAQLNRQLETQFQQATSHKKGKGLGL